MRTGVVLVGVLIVGIGLAVALLIVPVTAQQSASRAPSSASIPLAATPTIACPTMEPEMETVPDEDWYRYQGDKTAGNHASENAYCGQACAAMAIQKVTRQSIPITTVVRLVGTGRYQFTRADHLKVALDKWGVDYLPITSTRMISQALRDRGHPVIAVVSMAAVRQGPDCEGSGSDPETHCHKYVTYSDGHWMTLHTLSGEGNWVIAYDPFVFGSSANSIYWYSDGTAKGRNRYYLYSDLTKGFKAQNEPALEIIGPDWYRYQGEESAGQDRGGNAYSAQTCVAMAIQHLTGHPVAISDIVEQSGAPHDQILKDRALRQALDYWELLHEPLPDRESLRRAVYDRRHIVVARINTSVISKGDDFGRANTNPRIRHGKYASLDYEPGTSHWVVIRGIGRDDLGRWVIVHDPYVFNEGIHWYSDDMAKGRNRYFAYTEFEEALVAGSAREIMGHARPRLAARLYEQPKPRVLPPGEQASIAFSLQNVGWQTWEAGHYALVNVNDEPLDVPLEQIALDVDVPLGRSVRWPLTITVPLEPRLYRAEWQLSYDGELLGPVLAVSVLVRPDELGDVASMLEWAKKDARRYAEEWLTDRWEALWRQIMKALEREAERKARKLLRDLCGGPAATTAMSLALAWLGRRGYAPENEEDR